MFPVSIVVTQLLLIYPDIYVMQKRGTLFAKYTYQGNNQKY